NRQLVRCLIPVQVAAGGQGEQVVRIVFQPGAGTGDQVRIDGRITGLRCCNVVKCRLVRPEHQANHAPAQQQRTVVRIGLYRAVVSRVRRLVVVGKQRRLRASSVDGDVGRAAIGGNRFGWHRRRQGNGGLTGEDDVDVQRTKAA